MIVSHPYIELNKKLRIFVRLTIIIFGQPNPDELHISKTCGSHSYYSAPEFAVRRLASGSKRRLVIIINIRFYLFIFKKKYIQVEEEVVVAAVLLGEAMEDRRADPHLAPHGPADTITTEALEEEMEESWQEMKRE